METMRTEFEGCEQSKRRFLPHVHWPTFSTYDLGKRAAFISDEHLLEGATLSKDLLVFEVADLLNVMKH